MIVFITLSVVLIFAIAILLNNIGISFAQSIIFAYIFIVLLYFVGLLINSVLRSRLLSVKCDPEAFLLKTEKFLKRHGKKQRSKAYIYIDITAAYLDLGKFNDAFDIINKIDKNLISSEHVLFTYYNNLIYCLYMLGDIKFAEELFEDHVLSSNSKSHNLLHMKNTLIAEKFFYSHKYEESRAIFNVLLNGKITCKNRVYIIYMLALIDEAEGKAEDALIKYREVAEKGNKLYIAQQARLKLGI